MNTVTCRVCGQEVLDRESQPAPGNDGGSVCNRCLNKASNVNMATANCVANGAQILRRYWSDRNKHWLVCCYWRESAQPYVTWACDNDGHCFWGHYFKQQIDALADFAERVNKYRENYDVVTEGLEEPAVNDDGGV